MWPYLKLSTSAKTLFPMRVTFLGTRYWDIIYLSEGQNSVHDSLLLMLPINYLSSPPPLHPHCHSLSSSPYLGVFKASQQFCSHLPKTLGDYGFLFLFFHTIKHWKWCYSVKRHISLLFDRYCQFSSKNIKIFSPIYNVWKCPRPPILANTRFCQS